jgi:hypothetical protein
VALMTKIPDWEILAIARQLVRLLGEAEAERVAEKAICLCAESEVAGAGETALAWCRIKVAILQLTTPADGLH